MRIYMEVGDSFSAKEVVNEFARHAQMSEVERLRSNRARISTNAGIQEIR